MNTITLLNETPRRMASSIAITGALISYACAICLLVFAAPLVTWRLVPTTGGHKYLWLIVQLCILATCFLGYVVNALLARWVYRVPLRIHLATGGMTLAILWGAGFLLFRVVRVLDLWVALVVFLGVLILTMALVRARDVIIRVGSIAAGTNADRLAFGGALAGTLAYMVLLGSAIPFTFQLAVWAAATLAVGSSMAVLLLRSSPIRISRATAPELGRLRFGLVSRTVLPGCIALSCTSYLVGTFGTHPAIWLAPQVMYFTTLGLVPTSSGQRAFSDIGRLAAVGSLVALVIVVMNPTPGAWVFWLHVGLIGVVLAHLNWRSVGSLAAPPPTSSPGNALVGYGAALVIVLAAPIVLDPAWIPLSFLSKTQALFIPGAPEYLLFLGWAFMSVYRGGVRSTTTRLMVLEAGLLGAVLPLAVNALIRMPWRVNIIMTCSAVATLALVAVRVRSRLPAFTCGLMVVIVCAYQWRLSERVVHWNRSHRSEFRVVERGVDRALRRGFYTVGIQPIDCILGLRASGCSDPTLYYSGAGPLGRLMTEMRDGAETSRILVVGLGIGTVAAYCSPGTSMTFLESDSALIASAEHHFGYLSRGRFACSELAVHRGDSRSLVRGQAQSQFDVVVLDTFLSNPLPTHLLTTEAFREFARLLAPAGAIAVHVSNSFFDLAPVAASGLRAADLAALAIVDRGTAQRVGSTWVVGSPSAGVLEQLRTALELVSPREAVSANGALTGFIERPINEEIAAWTDERHRLWSVLRR
jgi:hypothetical protein